MEVWILAAHMTFNGVRIGYQLMADRDVWPRRSQCETVKLDFEAVFPRNTYECIRFRVRRFSYLINGTEK